MKDMRRHAGQLAIVGFAGYSIPPDLRTLAREFDLGGVVLFARNVEAPEQVSELSRDVQALAGEGTNPPGTSVNRISPVRSKIRVPSEVAGRTPRSPTRSSSPERHMERTLYFCATLSGAEIRRSGTRG